MSIIDYAILAEVKKLGNGGSGGNGGGGGIIDVETLPTANIDENAVYRVKREIVGEPAVYVCFSGMTLTVAELFEMEGVSATVTVTQVAELPEVMEPMNQSTFTIPLYIVESEGKAYLSMDGTSASAMTFGAMMQGMADCGWTDDPTSVTEDGVYCVRGEAPVEFYQYWTFKDGSWVEFMPIIDVNELPIENIILNTCYHNTNTNKYFVFKDGSWVEWSIGASVSEFVAGEGNGHFELYGDITQIAPYAFYGRQYTSITMPKTVTTIGENAFQNCPIKTIKYGGHSSIYAQWKDNIHTFGLTRDCVIEFVDRGMGVIGIEYKKNEAGEYTVGKNHNLLSNDVVYIVADIDGVPVTSIGDEAFYDNKDITNLEFAENSKITSIGTDAFTGCDFDTVVLPDGLKTIGASAFKGMNALTITIPDSVTSIGASAFANAEGSIYITYKGTQEQWDAIDKHVSWKDMSTVNVSCSGAPS